MGPTDAHPFPRPPWVAGMAVRSCLTTMPSTMLVDLAVRLDVIVRDGEVDPILREVLVALGMDVHAAAYEADDQLDALLDEPLDE